MSDPRKGFRQAAERALWKIHELEATVGDFNGDQSLLNNRLNGLVAELGGLASHREALAVDVPVELLRYVDEGGNPDAFTSDIFQRANRSNQLAKGKVEGFAAFREALLQEAGKAFPEETKAFKALGGTSGAKDTSQATRSMDGGTAS